MPNNKKFIISANRKEIVKNENDLSLLDIPTDILRLIESRLDIKSKVQFISSCKSMNNFFQPYLDKELLKFASFGMKTKLDALLKNIPDLLYKRGITIDPCGRIIHGSVYRIALGAKDLNPFPDMPFEEMVEMIERHMLLLPNGNEEIEIQRVEQFPENWDEQEKIREENDSTELKKVFAAIDQSNTDDDCKNAIEEFIRYLQSQNEIKTGYHYNDKLLSEAKRLYKDNYYKFGGYDHSYKNKLASIKVIGNIQGRMTACLAMAYCHGINRLLGRQMLNRRITLDNNNPFFSPAPGSSHFTHSYEYACCAVREISIDTGGGPGPDLMMRQYNAYIELKQVASNSKIPQHQKRQRIPHA